MRHAGLLQASEVSSAAYVGHNADPALTLVSLLDRSDVVTLGADGGGLDDLYGLSVLGREQKSGRRWLLWSHAWCHKTVLARRDKIAPRLLDFSADGDLTITDRIGDDVVQIADIVEQIRDAGKFPETGAIGVDPVGIGALLDELGKRGITASTKDAAGMIDGISQGWQLQGAIKALERKLAGDELVHSGSRMMAWCVGNAKVEPRANGLLITKQASGFAKIDPLMAAFNAVALMEKNPRPGSGIFEYYKSAAAANGPRADGLPGGSHERPKKVCLRAPAGISTVYGISGRQYVVGADRLIETTEEDAKPLIGQGFERLAKAET